MICQTAGCCKEVGKRRVLCKKCQTRTWKLNNPIRVCFHNLKSNSKKRGIEFSLTFEQFESFCTKTNYIVGRGRTKTSYTIDRIRNNEGYHIGNIQVLTKHLNSSKGTKKLETWWDDYEHKLKAKVIVLDQGVVSSFDPDDCPY